MNTRFALFEIDICLHNRHAIYDTAEEETFDREEFTFVKHPGY